MTPALASALVALAGAATAYLRAELAARRVNRHANGPGHAVQLDTAPPVADPPQPGQ